VQNIAKISMNIELQSAIDWGQEFREKVSVWQFLTLRKTEIADRNGTVVRSHDNLTGRTCTRER
jgi:hypothetical protein